MRKQIRALLALAAVATLAVSVRATSFTAYNDCQSFASTNAANTTLYGYGGPGLSGALKDFTTGTTLGATVTLVNTGASTAGTGPNTEFTAGTDAANIFGGIVGSSGSVIYYGGGAWSVDLVFDNLTAGATYNLATTLDRGNVNATPSTGYTDRWTRISISGADASTYASSPAAVKIGDSTTSIQSYNSTNGYVAKWTAINPGADKQFKVTFTNETAVSIPPYPSGATQNGNKGYGPMGFMLEEIDGAPPPPPPPPVTGKYVIAISVDGMGSKYVSPLLASSSLPNIARLIAEGAGTLNARDDADRAVTLQNHTDMVTGRGTLGASGHNWDVNAWSSGTLASNKGSYVASMFDVAHDNGMRTGMWASKSKFNLLTTSYDATNGAGDVTGADNGKNKLDTSYVSEGVSAATLTTAFTTAMTANPFNLSFIHYQDPDAAGHGSGWGSATYNTTLMAIDTQIGNLLAYIAGNATLNGNTTIILTADHGGTGTSHGDITNANDYTIPFLVWGAGVGAGDLYGMNSLFRLSPLTTGGAAGNPPFSDIMQPIRNGELGNLALDLLGLGPIPGSTIDSAQDLVLVLVPEPAALALGAMAFAGLLTWRRRRAA